MTCIVEPEGSRREKAGGGREGGGAGRETERERRRERVVGGIYTHSTYHTHRHTDTHTHTHTHKYVHTARTENGISTFCGSNDCFDFELLSSSYFSSPKLCCRLLPTTSCGCCLLDVFAFCWFPRERLTDSLWLGVRKRLRIYWWCSPQWFAYSSIIVSCLILGSQSHGITNIRSLIGVQIHLV